MYSAAIFANVGFSNTDARGAETCGGAAAGTGTDLVVAELTAVSVRLSGGGRRRAVEFR